MVRPAGASVNTSLEGHPSGGEKAKFIEWDVCPAGSDSLLSLCGSDVDPPAHCEPNRPCPPALVPLPPSWLPARPCHIEKPCWSPPCASSLIGIPPLHGGRGLHGMFSLISD